MNDKKLITLKIRTPRGAMNIGSEVFEYNVPRAVEITPELAKHLDGDRVAVAHYFTVEPFEGEIPAPVIKPVKGEIDEEGTGVDEGELREILEGGSAETLLAFIKSKGVEAVPADILRQVLNSLKIQVRANATPEKMAEALSKFVNEE